MSNANELELYDKRLQLCLKYFNYENGIIYYKYKIGHLIRQIFRDCAKSTFYIKLQPKTDTEILNMKQLTNYINQHITEKVKLEGYLYIDVQDFYENCECYLADIPVRMIMKKKTFILVGAIAYNYSKFNFNIVHYTAFCRTINNNWCLKDNLSKKIKYIKNCLYSTKIAIVMYVECPV